MQWAEAVSEGIEAKRNEGLSITRVAAAIDTSVTTLYNWQKGLKPEVEPFIRACIFFGLDPLEAEFAVLVDVSNTCFGQTLADLLVLPESELVVGL